MDEVEFEAAQALWMDPNLLELIARTEGEPRFLVIGKIAWKHWSAVITYRKGCVRMISVRRARKREIKLYES